jgi:isopentenyl diphosphate isomerase/L-lactate dehydrogenase-like FMN-dependent dehydrogenase
MDEMKYPSRRTFLRFLAGSPLLSLVGFQACTSPDSAWTLPEGAVPEGAPRGSKLPEDVVRELADRIASPDDAINVFDFQAVAEQVLPPAHYGYLATGVDGDETLRANRDGFERFDLRARRLVDVSEIDLSVDLLGERWDTPIVLAPVGSQKAFHAEGELAAARASAAAGHHQILSTVTTTSVEDVNAARSRPVWYQLYPTSSWTVGEKLVRRAEDAGCQALVLTVDLPVDSNRETLERYIRKDPRDCEECHEAAPGDDDPMNMPTGWLRRKPMFDGLDMSRVYFGTPSMTWEFIGRLRDTTDMQIVVKGIVRDDDARRCVEYGADAVVVSNHGGRAEASGRSTIESLPEVVDAVGGRIPVLIDGGFRRGTDVLKALALGADAICIGRPYIWGLAAFGQEGVEKVLEILRAELRLAMQLHGVPSVAALDRSFITGG